MAPVLLSKYHVLQRREPSLSTVSSDIVAQWSNPADILSLLLLVGGDVIQRALAQQTGGHYPLPTPVVFSFGWVAYTFLGLLAAVGDKTFLPSPEFPAVVFSTEFGYHRINNSWVVARLIRDFEELWMPTEVKNKLAAMLAQTGPPGGPTRKKAGLCVSVFQASSKPGIEAGVPRRDFLWYGGYLVAALQLGIAAVPWATDGIWEIFAITALGTALAFLTASLPHWTEEKWTCNRNSKKTFVLTRGNGAQHAIAIVGAGKSLDFEDMATSSSERLSYSAGKPLINSVLTILWCGLLISVGGIHNQTWFLVAVGAIGTIYTVIVAGAPRQPESFGVYLEYLDVFVQPKVMKTLQAAETRYSGLGRSMLRTFFPGDLRPDEADWWKESREKELLIKKTKSSQSKRPEATSPPLLKPSGTSQQSSSSSLSTSTAVASSHQGSDSEEATQSKSSPN